jgi:hypothetical protein
LAADGLPQSDEPVQPADFLSQRYPFPALPLHRAKRSPERRPLALPPLRHHTALTQQFPQGELEVLQIARGKRLLHGIYPLGQSAHHSSQQFADLSVVHPEHPLKGLTLRLVKEDVRLEDGLLAADAVAEDRLDFSLRARWTRLLGREDDLSLGRLRTLIRGGVLGWMVEGDLLMTRLLRKECDSLLLLNVLLSNSAQLLPHASHFLLEVVQTGPSLSLLLLRLLRRMLVSNHAFLLLTLPLGPR